MSKPIDHLLGERYHRQANNCLHFTARAWEYLTGDTRLRALQEGDMASMRSVLRAFRQVDGPTVEPAVMVMEYPYGDTHMGVCYQRRLLQLTQKGASFFDIHIAQIMYRHLRYYQ